MKNYTGSPVPRYQVFTTSDGVFVVQWDPKYVQELLTGQYRAYEHKSDFGHPVTDYELKQLKAAGRVEHFNRRYVWLYALPERGRFGTRVMDKANRVRTYYLSTVQPQSYLAEITALLEESGLDGDFLARNRNDFVVILGKNGAPFRTVQEAETAQKTLQTRVPDVFDTLTIAFIETRAKDIQQMNQVPITHQTAEMSLDDIIASQGDTAHTEGKRVVLAVSQEDEREALAELFAEMKLVVHIAPTGSDALVMLEDYQPNLLVMDVQLPDMHGWQLLNIMKEIQSLRALPVLVIMDEPQVVPAGRVQTIIRPVSMARLRHTIWTLFKNAGRGA